MFITAQLSEFPASPRLSSSALPHSLPPAPEDFSGSLAVSHFPDSPDSPRGLLFFSDFP